MKFTPYLLLLTSLLGIQSISALKVSLIIPCKATHISFLPSLLALYTQQTRIPDEVVVSVSEVHSTHATLSALMKKEWPYSLKIITTHERRLAGQNRNIACHNATGDIFVCQDADDIPHPQRIEIIHYFFTHYDLDHLQHKWSPVARFQIIDDFSAIKPVHIVHHTECYGQHYTQGVPTISRALFKKIQWGNQATGEDTFFNGNVYKITDKTLLIPVVLYQYRK